MFQIASLFSHLKVSKVAGSKEGFDPVNRHPAFGLNQPNDLIDAIASTTNYDEKVEIYQSYLEKQPAYLEQEKRAAERALLFKQLDSLIAEAEARNQSESYVTSDC